MEWISVKDRLPPDDPDLLIKARSEGLEFDELAHFVHRYPSTYSEWQPLPPKETA